MSYRNDSGQVVTVRDADNKKIVVNPGDVIDDISHPRFAACVANGEFTDLNPPMEEKKEVVKDESAPNTVQPVSVDTLPPLPLPTPDGPVPVVKDVGDSVGNDAVTVEMEVQVEPKKKKRGSKK